MDWRQMTTPRRQGRSAFLQGEGQYANPYEEGSPCFRQWLAGYAAARKKGAA